MSWFDSVPLDLRPTLSAYKFIAASMDDAIKMAKSNGKWTQADEKAYNAFNGGKAWGQFDGFVSETKQFNDDFSAALKENPATAMQKAVNKGIRRDVAAHPEKYATKYSQLASGRTVIYRKDKDTGKESKTYYDTNGRMMSEGDFLKAEQMESLSYDSKSGKLLCKYIKPEEASTPWSEMSTGDKALAIVGGVVTVATGGIFASCSDYYDIDNVNIGVTQITDQSTVLELMSTLSSLLIKIASLEEQIAENTGTNNQLVKELTEEVKKLRADIEDIKKHMVTIITNQENSAANAQKYYQLIITAIGDNGDLLAMVVDQLAQSNTTLNEIKELMKQNNADNKEILEAITKCKYGLDQLHEDNKEITKLLNEVKVAITNLPDNLKDKFSGYFKSIILGIADNGAKLQALTNLLHVVNVNIVNGHTAILEKLDKMQEVLDNLFAKFSKYGDKMIALLNEIATSIANLTAKVDKIDLDKIEQTLSAILDKIGNNGEKMDELARLLKLVNGNVTANGQTQKAILEAVNQANGLLVEGFANLVEIGNKNNWLQADTNKLINVVIDLIKSLPNNPSPGVDISGLMKSLDEVIKAINNNTIAVNNQGSNANAWLQDIYSLLAEVKGAVDCGNAANVSCLNKILQAIKDLDMTCADGFKAVIKAINNKTTQGVDLSKIEATLDKILQAIKDHKVKVVIEDNRTPCAQPGDNVNEGEIDDINQMVQDLNELFG